MTKKLDLRDWASIAEIGSGIGVIISLLIVAHSVNQNTEVLLATSDDLTYQAVHAAQSAKYTSPELASVVALVNKGEALSDSQAVMWDQFQSSFLTIWENAFYRHSRGLMSDADWEAWDVYFRVYFSAETTGMQQMDWHVLREYFGREFVQHIDDRLFQPE